MPAPGETDLEAMLAALDVTRRPGTFRYLEVGDTDDVTLAGAEAVVREDGSITLVVRVDGAAGDDGPGGVLDVAWLTLTVASSLEAVGLTAVVGAALAQAGIPCNVLAGVRHDHLLVPVDRADEAMAILRAGSRAQRE